MQAISLTALIETYGPHFRCYFPRVVYPRMWGEFASTRSRHRSCLLILRGQFGAFMIFHLWNFDRFKCLRYDIMVWLFKWVMFMKR